MFFDGEDTSPKPQIEEGITEVAWKNDAKITEEVFPKHFQKY